MQYVFIKFDEANYATNISQVVNLSDEQAYYHCACSEFRNQCGSGSEEEFIDNYGHWLCYQMSGVNLAFVGSVKDICL